MKVPVALYRLNALPLSRAGNAFDPIGQTKVVRMPNIMAPATKNPSLSAMQVSFTLQFVEPFIFPSGMYNATVRSGFG